ncbi:hypothetical protein HMPREF0539_1608 [Lacticaseibacillus rhamnosus LMS2-1]|jgi:hypothetical protein|uniref:Uncharacterized protein n=1 Tax=Lacticaseibacillus rhamnosus (strain LMS2-1) TaxID=525361 RepID=C2JXH4_LACRM|nr:hypothetical protein HMPREF0539_1608 [Lacticaseibacillus rhamnosus LMS2-1]
MRKGSHSFQTPASQEKFELDGNGFGTNDQAMENSSFLNKWSRTEATVRQGVVNGRIYV